VGFGHGLTIQASQIPLVGQLYAGLCSTIIGAIAAEYAGIVSKRDFSYRRVGFGSIALSQRFGRADIYTRTTADAGIQVKFRFASVLFRNLAGLSRKTSGKSRRKYRYDGFF